MITGPQLLDRLSWRYATKQFDPLKRIDDAVWQTLEEALVLTPSSWGLQPWKFLVITDMAIRERLVEASWNQRQVVDCSHLVVFAVKTRMTEEDVDAYLDRMVEVRGGTRDSLAGFRKVLVGDVVTGPRSKAAAEWATRQAYIALGNFMTCAALLSIDTCPMEGFEPLKYDAILGLTDRHLTSAVVCPAGYRAETDKYARMAKVRFRPNEIIERL